MKNFSVILLFFFALTASAGFEVSQENLKKDVETLAQPAWKGRQAGTSGGAAARAWLKQEFIKIGIRPVAKNYEQNILKRKSVIGVNLIGVLGPEEKQCMIIGAHYDHKGVGGEIILRGADDNASGVAVMLEIARQIKPRESELQKCIYFAAWDFEEGSARTFGGIKGSHFFVNNPVFDLKKLALSVTFDLLGGSFCTGVENQLYVLGTVLS